MDELEYRTVDILSERLYHTNREILDWEPIDDNGTIIALVHNYVSKVYIVMKARLGRKQGILTNHIDRRKTEESAKASFRKIAESYGITFETWYAL